MTATIDSRSEYLGVDLRSPGLCAFETFEQHHPRTRARLLEAESTDSSAGDGSGLLFPEPLPRTRSEDADRRSAPSGPLADRMRPRSLDELVARLLIHGTLHLVGHDHEGPEEARAMRAEERRLWRTLRA